MHDVFHASLLTPFIETEAYGPSNPRPLPEIVDNHPEWEVENILKHRRTRNNTLEFQVKWKGYPITESTWEPEDNLLEHSKEILDDYHRRKKIAQTSQSAKPSSRRTRTRRK